MKKISIINQKGGSGKTSFSVLCCLALAQRGFKVLAVDCDPQGGMSRFMGFENDNQISNMLLGNEFKTNSSISSDIRTEIQIVTSGYSFDAMYVTVDFMRLKLALKNSVSDFDYIIFDTPPTMQGITRAAIHVSDKIFVPCELSKSALNPTLYTLDCLAELEKEGEVVLIDKDTSKYKGNLRAEFTDNIAGPVKMIRRDITSQKIISGECRLTEDKIKKYLDPVYRILEG